MSKLYYTLIDDVIKRFKSDAFNLIEDDDVFFEVIKGKICPHSARDENGVFKYKEKEAGVIEERSDIAMYPSGKESFETKIVNKLALVDTDIGMIRVIDDLIDVLVSKGHMSLSDLPAGAKAKYDNRKGLRT